MKSVKSMTVRAVLVTVALVAVISGLIGAVQASHVVAEIEAPAQATVAAPVDVRVTLRSAAAGEPVAGARVDFYAEASFGGVAGEVDLGSAVTDAEGVAVIRYGPRTDGVQQIRAEHVAADGGEHVVATRSVAVAGAGQLHKSAAGVEIPGLNVWLLIGLVGTVWAILFSVGLRVIAIARAGGGKAVVASIPAARAETLTVAHQPGVVEV